MAENEKPQKGGKPADGKGAKPAAKGKDSKGAKAAASGEKAAPKPRPKDYKPRMKMHYEKGNSFRQMARLLGVSESRVARRIHRISSRLLDGRYIACLRNRDRLSSDQMSVAKDYFLRGLSQSKIAEKKRWSLYRVGRTIREIESVIARTQQRSRRARVISCCEGRHLS